MLAPTTAPDNQLNHCSLLAGFRPHQFTAHTTSIGASLVSEVLPDSREKARALHAKLSDPPRMGSASAPIQCMFTVLSEESVSGAPGRYAFYVSLIIHVSVSIALFFASLMREFPVRFELTTVYAAGSSEPVRDPQPIYLPVRAAVPSRALSRAREAAMDRKREIASPGLMTERPRSAYTPTSIPDDLLAFQAAGYGTPTMTGVLPSSSRTLAIPFPLLQELPPPPPERPPGDPDVKPPVVIGGRFEPAVLVDQVTPVYPALARTARIQGVVSLEGTVDTAGQIENLKIVSGHPMLIDAALNAVRKWKYRPAKLNGQIIASPVNVQVRFTLQYPG
jgi:TonB family protein